MEKQQKYGYMRSTIVEVNENLALFEVRLNSSFSQLSSRSYSWKVANLCKTPAKADSSLAHLLQVAAIFFWTIKFWSGSAGE